MSFENFNQEPQVQPEEEKAPQKSDSAKTPTPIGKFGKWIKRNATLVGVIGATLGGAQESVAADTGAIRANDASRTNGSNPNIEHVSEKSPTKMASMPGSFEVLEKDAGSTWGTELVQKYHEDGRDFFAQRYVKINNATGDVVVLGEYDNVLQAADSLSVMKGIPESLVKNAQLFAGPVRAEREFAKSGLVAPDPEVVKRARAEGNTHLEEREYKGSGYTVKTEVEADSEGNIVNTLDMKDFKTSSPRKK